MAEERSGDIPDIYCNSVQLGISPYDLTIELQQRKASLEGQEQKPVAVGTVRMSFEHAKVLAIILRKTLKVYEDQAKRPIPVHPELLDQLGISEAEDW